MTGWLGLYQIRKNKMLYAFVTLQIMIMFVVTLAVASLFVYHVKYYNCFKPYLDDDGIYAYADTVMLENQMLCESSVDLEAVMRKTNVIACYSPWVTIKNTNNDMNFRAYDKEIIEAYVPEIDKGEWLPSDSGTGEIVHAVVSSNTYGLQVGDIIDLVDVYELQTDTTIPVMIVGVLEDGARIYGGAIDNSVEESYKVLYQDYYLHEQGMPILLMNINELNAAMTYYDNHSIERQMHQNLLICYDEDITEEEIAYNERFVNTYIESTIIYDFEHLKKSSIQYIKQMLSFLLPVFGAIFITAAISILCVNAIVVKKQLKNYAIYHVCGMPWENCIYINAMTTLFIVATTLLVTICIICCVGWIGVLDETAISVGSMQILLCIIVGAIYVVIAVILPLDMLRNQSAKAILTENRE